MVTGESGHHWEAGLEHVDNIEGFQKMGFDNMITSRTLVV